LPHAAGSVAACCWQRCAAPWHAAGSRGMLLACCGQRLACCWQRRGMLLAAMPNVGFPQNSPFS